MRAEESGYANGLKDFTALETERDSLRAENQSLRQELENKKDSNEAIDLLAAICKDRDEELFNLRAELANSKAASPTHRSELRALIQPEEKK
jgi:cell shape-determining protein MreC